MLLLEAPIWNQNFKARPTICVVQNAVVDTRYSYSLITPISAITGLFGGSGGGSITLTAQAVMPCET